MSITQHLIEGGLVFGLILSFVLFIFMAKVRPKNDLERAFLFREGSLLLFFVWFLGNSLLDRAFNVFGAAAAIGLCVSAVWIIVALVREYQTR